MSITDLRTVLRWQDADPDTVAGRTVVVIDVLRWTTVVVAALANGAARVEACATPADAEARARTLGRDRVVLGGERENRALPGFDVGNSPLEYVPVRVAGRVVVTTTTNGTQALLRAAPGSHTIVGAFTNCAAVVAALLGATAGGAAGPRGVTLLCAGRSGEEALEDTVCAGAIADGIVRALSAADPATRGGGARFDAATRRAMDLWREAGADAARAVSLAPHAAVLRSDGFGADVDAACSHSTVSVVPQARGAGITLVPA
ncbi:MAG: 2-phosphosulfolactate phosphatase [Gemmatimonadales bacterium]|nr:2-phosphosulfolactate phosphatase [Gemmatimonadota bacterium]MCL4214351.1 2-phosphosulfolactate phosphatase [Gemmatimonadales bacterium]